MKEKTMLISDYSTKTTIINFAIMEIYFTGAIAKNMALDILQASLFSLLMIFFYCIIALFFGAICAWLGDKPFFYRRNMVNFSWVLLVLGMMQMSR